MQDLAPEGRRARKKRERRQRILRVARDLFVAQGYERTTLDEIAEAADISRATVFTLVAAILVITVDIHKDLINAKGVTVALVSGANIHLWQREA